MAMRMPMKRDEFFARRFFHTQKLDKINKRLLYSTKTRLFPNFGPSITSEMEIEAYRIYKYKERLRKKYETNSVFRFFDSIGLGDVVTDILSNTIDGKKIEVYLKVEEIKDEVYEEVNKRMFYKSRRCSF